MQGWGFFFFFCTLFSSYLFIEMMPNEGSGEIYSFVNDKY